MITVSKYADVHDIVRDSALKVAHSCDDPFIQRLLYRAAEEHAEKHDAQQFLLFADKMGIPVKNVEIKN